MSVAMIVNIHEAKTNLSKLIALLQKGEEVIIAKSGSPVAKLIPIEKKKRDKKPNILRGKVHIASDFDSADTEIEMICQPFFGTKH